MADIQHVSSVNKRILYPFLLALTCFVLALLVGQFYKSQHNFNSQAQDINKYLEEKTNQVTSIADSLMNIFCNKESIPQLDRPIYHAPGLLVYQEDSLIYWDNEMLVPPDSLLSEISTEPNIYSFQTITGVARIVQEQMGCKFIQVIPLKNNYPFQSLHFRDRHGVFPGSNVAITNDPSEKAINLNGTIVGYLQKNESPSVCPPILQVLLIFGAFLFLFILFHFWAESLAQSTRPWMAGVVLVVGLFLIRAVSLTNGWTEALTCYTLFDPIFETPFLGSSLGDLLINVVLLLWVITFFYKHTKFASLSEYSLFVKVGITTLNYLTIILAILAICGVLKNLVARSDLEADFERLFFLDSQGIITLTGVVLLLFALFLFTHKLMVSVVRKELPLLYRLIALIISMIISIPIIQYSDISLPVPHLMSFVFFFIMLFDVFIDNKTHNFSWMVIWLVVFSAFSSILIFKYSFDEKEQMQLNYAQSLANPRDTVAEKSINNLVERNNYSIEKIFDNYNRLPYLVNNYRISYSQIKNQAVQSLHYDSNSKTFKVSLKDSTEVTFTRNSFTRDGLYSELYRNGSYKGLKHLHLYDYAVYFEGEKVESNSKAYGELLNSEIVPEADGIRIFRSGSSRQVLYNKDGNNVAVVGYEETSLYRPLSLFSFIFTILIIVVLFFSVLNILFNAFPESMLFSMQTLPSLKARIQLSVIAIIVLSFLVIGFVTAIYFNNTRETQKQNYLHETAHSIQSDLEFYLSKNEKENDIPEVLDQFSHIHGIDIDLYNLNGDLLNSSVKGMMTNGIIPPKMDYRALFALKEKGALGYTSFEQIGDISFSKAYRSIRNQAGTAVAFAGVPFFRDRLSEKEADAAFMGTLLNVYVFLLILAGIIAIIVSKSVTHPLQIIGKKLKQVKLGKANQPLEWKNNDEIGELVTEYNGMIRQIEKSATLLAKSEREGAWREMAKQVAHEIKNPLTPMKLSIQHLQRAYQSNPEEAAPLIKKVTDTLIKQIDNLAHIATEFSNFAKMPSAKNEPLDLNELIQSLYDLFYESPEAKLNLELCPSPPVVFADKNHLRQVFTNLISNGLQSIPDGQNGKIDIKVSILNEDAIVEISDNGLGIPVELREKVFVPYFTTKNSGSGLGLAIAKNIVDALNGEIGYETEVNRGTTFFVRIPLSNDD